MTSWMSMLVRLQRPKASPFFGVLVFGTGFGCGNARLVIIQLLFPAHPMGWLVDLLSTYFKRCYTIKSSSVMHRVSDSELEPLPFDIAQQSANHSHGLFNY